MPVRTGERLFPPGPARMSAYRMNIAITATENEPLSSTRSRRSLTCDRMARNARGRVKTILQASWAQHLIQTVHCARIKDSPTARPRYYCCVMTTAPSVFTQPSPISAIAEYRRRCLAQAGFHRQSCSAPIVSVRAKDGSILSIREHYGSPPADEAACL
jgi:hypothetical protein